MIGQIWARLQLLFAMGQTLLVEAGKVQVRVMDGEPLNNINRVEPYGFSYRPPGGGEAYLLFPRGDRSKGFAIVLGDKRYQMDLMDGEVALHDDQGQVVHLRRDGILIKGKRLRFEGEDISFHADKSWSWDVGGFGERWTAGGGGAWEHKTWQIGAAVTDVPGPISPPEGP